MVGRFLAVWSKARADTLLTHQLQSEYAKNLQQCRQRNRYAVGLYAPRADYLVKVLLSIHGPWVDESRFPAAAPPFLIRLYDAAGGQGIRMILEAGKFH